MPRKWKDECSKMKWKEKLFPSNVMSESVMKINVSVMLTRDFGGNMNIYSRSEHQNKFCILVLVLAQ